MTEDESGDQQNELYYVLWEVCKHCKFLSEKCKTTVTFLNTSWRNELFFQKANSAFRGSLAFRMESSSSCVWTSRRMSGSFYWTQWLKADLFRDIFLDGKIGVISVNFWSFEPMRDISLQGKGGDAFRSTNKMNELKMKIPL